MYSSISFSPDKGIRASRFGIDRVIGRRPLRVIFRSAPWDHSLALSLVRICAEDRSAEGVRGLDHARTADEAGDTLA
jgi:hypothetical protein